METKECLIRDPLSFIKIVQTEAFEATQIIQIIGLKPISRKVGKALLRCAKYFHGVNSFDGLSPSRQDRGDLPCSPGGQFLCDGASQ
jgi:hypothetical protein